MENSIKLALEIIQINKKAGIDIYLTGSLGLHLQDVKMPNPPKDIDFYCPKSYVLTGFDRIYQHEDLQEDYENEFYDRMTFTINGIKVDFFTPLPDTYGTHNINDVVTPFESIKCVVPHEIIGWKVYFALAGKESAKKHKENIISILENSL